MIDVAVVCFLSYLFFVVDRNAQSISCEKKKKCRFVAATEHNKSDIATEQHYYIIIIKYTKAVHWTVAASSVAACMYRNDDRHVII